MGVHFGSGGDGARVLGGSHGVRDKEAGGLWVHLKEGTGNLREACSGEGQRVPAVARGVGGGGRQKGPTGGVMVAKREREQLGLLGLLEWAAG
jgi:hypothetical protein